MRDIGRNESCHCGSGKKYKKCCLLKDEQSSESRRMIQESIDDDWGYELFGNIFPKIVEQETRNITIKDSNGADLPNGTYVFHEMFCRERGCDCRRVFFYVTATASSNEVEAVICYGWEPVSFYREWFKDGDPYAIAELKGPSLNEGSPQSIHAPAILELVKNVLLRDQNYIERVKSHYTMFKSRINGDFRNN